MPRACRSSVIDVDQRSDAGLVAAILGGRSTEASGAALIEAFGGLAEFATADATDLADFIARIGVRATTNAPTQLVTAFELGRRAALAACTPPRRFASSDDAAAWAMPRLGPLAHEELWMLALDGKSRLRSARCIAKGGLHGAAVRAADPLRFALRAAASGFVLVHNHPSGDATPSTHDVAFTAQVAAAGTVVGLPLLDHVIVTREAFEPVPFDGGPA